jgi:hypothetical protein
MPRTSYAPPARRRAPVRRKAPARKPRSFRPVPGPGMVRSAKSSSAGSAYRSAGSGVGAAIGTALGGPAGGAIGGLLGRGAGAVLSKIMGHGDYAVSNAPSVAANSLLINAANIPQFGTGKVAVNFKHREFIGDVFSASTANTFKIDSYSINPGLNVSFPWLAGVVGGNFQQYRINGMTYEYRSMSSDALNSTNTALGSVIMATDYDSADGVFASKQEMENTEYGVSCKPSVNMLHAIECARTQTPVSELYIRAFDVPSGKDIRMYDLGRFSIATTGFQGTNVNCGELWVTYDIDAFKAIEQVPAYINPYSQFEIKSASATAPLGTLRNIYPVTNGANQIGITFVSKNRFEFPYNVPVGSTYYFNMTVIGAAAAAFTKPVITCGNGLYFNINVDAIIPTTGTTTSVWSFACAVQYKGGGTPSAQPYVNVADYTWAPVGGILAMDLQVSQVSGLFGGSYTSTTA